MVYKKYSDKQKAAYYKRKASGAAPTYTVRGRGDYKTKASAYYKKAVSNYRKPYRYPGAGAAIGGAIGGAFGHPGIGSAIGAGAHSLMKTVTGYGDYNVAQNSLVYNRDAVPEFTVNNKRCTMISHREFITDISGSIDFEKRVFRINPGVDTTFPWLASVAENYEQYVVQGMIFEFKTTCATAIGSTNTALGTVVLATQYNSLSPEFQSKQQMENYEFAISSVPSQSVLHPIECDPTQTQCGGIFNMADPADADGDRRLYDVGRFTIATVGMQAESVIGELWVTYKICFLKPRLRSSDEDAVFLYQNVPGSISTNNPFGNEGDWKFMKPEWDSDLAFVLNSNTIGIRPGFVGVVALNIYWDCTNAVTAANTATTVTGINCTNVTTSVITTVSGQLANYLLPVGSGGNGVLYQTVYIKCIGHDFPHVAFTGFSIAGGACNIVRIQAITLPSEFIDYPY
ncbi:capsid protein [Crucivirus-255]|nr:capsid protein [Crucivirus-255]